MAEKREIEQTVEKIMNEYFANVSKKADFDIVSFAKKLGFVILNANLDPDDDGFILVDPNKNLFDFNTNKLIAVNYRRSLKEKRYIIAHELGHYFLHSNNGTKLFAHKDKNVRTSKEDDADYFASSLLISKKELEEDLSLLGNTSDTTLSSLLLSNKYNVEQEIVLKRISDVKLLNSGN